MAEDPPVDIKLRFIHSHKMVSSQEKVGAFTWREGCGGRWETRPRSGINGGGGGMAATTRGGVFGRMIFLTMWVGPIAAETLGYKLMTTKI